MTPSDFDHRQATAGARTNGELHSPSVDAEIKNLSIKSSIKSPSDSSSLSLASPKTPADVPNPANPPILKMEEPAKPKAPSRSKSRKIDRNPPKLFLDEQDKYDEATASFSVIEDCTYANKHIGSTEPALECDCSEEWDGGDQKNNACGEDSDCINRATKMECVDDCSCGANCQNTRFLRKQWADVSVFKTEKKGYGLRANTDLRPDDFIFEYIGEVITEPTFRRRAKQYSDEGIKHFYFMSLNKGEFIDATKRGNLGRFCNHSCNPNCYVDKWVVGDRLRMGIFVERAVKAGEELVFNYNVDRYGADPQPCYCGEPNCTGFLGGKTQTEAGPKLSHGTMEALGLGDYDDEYYWETAVKKAKKAKKTGENDSDYVDQLQSKNLDEDGVTKVMATLMQCKERWIAVRLLARLQNSEDERVHQKVVRMHGYRILKAALNNFLDDPNVVLQVLDILFKLPRITRNKIQDSGIDEIVSKLQESEDEGVSKQSAEILKIWASLEVAYRIPRMKRDPNAAPVVRLDRRNRSRSRERSKTPITAPTGPKNNNSQRHPGFFQGGPRSAFRPKPTFKDLPAGWFCVTDNASGKLYYYNSKGERTWTRPTEPAVSTPPPGPKKERELTHEEKLQQIINSVTKSAVMLKDKSPAVGTPQNGSVDQGNSKADGWKSLPEEKQKKIYENTLYPHVKYVLDKYKDKLPREDIKRFGKEVSKKLVNSDFKNNRVTDPNTISSKQEKAVKKYVKEFFDKAVLKHRSRGNSSFSSGSTKVPPSPSQEGASKGTEAEDDDAEGTKRKWEAADEDNIYKKVKVEDEIGVPTPPPPPPEERGLDGDEGESMVDRADVML